MGGARGRGVHRPWSILWPLGSDTREGARKGTKAAAAFPRRRGLGGGVMAHVARGLKRIPYMFFNSLADTDCDSDGPVIVPAAVGCAESFNSPPPPHRDWAQRDLHQPDHRDEPACCYRGGLGNLNTAGPDAPAVPGTVLRPWRLLVALRSQNIQSWDNSG